MQQLLGLGRCERSSKYLVAGSKFWIFVILIRSLFIDHCSWLSFNTNQPCIPVFYTQTEYSLQYTGYNSTLVYSYKIRISQINP